MVGSMGCLLSLAMGVSENLPNKYVIAIDGDSSCLMRLGALYTLTQKQPKNLCYIVLDNESNESTGGQRNSSGRSRLYNVMNSLCPTFQVKLIEEIVTRLYDFKKTRRYTQIYCKIKTGTLEGLPRPERDLILGQVKRFKQAVLE
jgi:phosphonopyruvate decarboxylase